MKLRWGALSIVLVASALMPRVLTAQGTQNPAPARKSGALKQNYPNPFNPETRIPFTIGDEKQHNVFMRVTDPELQKVTGKTAPIDVMGALRAMKDKS